MKDIEENLQCNMMTPPEIESSTITKCISRKKHYVTCPKEFSQYQYQVCKRRQSI